MVRYILIIILILLASPIYATNFRQDSVKYPFTIGVKSHYGFIIIHSRAIREIKDSYPIGFEIDFSWHQNGQKQWDNCHCYPRVGLMVNYFYFDNPEILGNGFSAVYYIEPFFGAHRKLSFSTRAGAGLTYLTNPYDEVTNPNNLSYSTHLNSFLLIDLTVNYRISEKISLNVSGSYNHTSNGGIKVPNKGLNFPTAGLGIDYTYEPQEFINWDKTKFKETGKKRQRLDMDMLGILKSYKHGEPLEHLIWGGSVNYSYQIGRLSALVGSTELMVNGVVKEEMKRKGIQGVSHARVGLLFGHEFLMGRYHFSTQMGIYAYRPYVDNDYDLLYQRYKLTYRFANGLYTGISLKAHRQVADYFDIRIGYSLEKITPK
ncbi:MAG: acyloxyacyl hydrolase [Bacteroidota bacterium]